MAVPTHSPSSSSLWVFGYGSLVWNPGFEYRSSRVGFIRGYTRRFWQGNTNHRGTVERPGRVATLAEEDEGITWGRAFQLIDESSVTALDYLQGRETSLGGYRTQIVPFQPKTEDDEGDQRGAAGSVFPVLLYVATSDNPFYLGPASLPDMASQVASTKGNCGHNAEYVLRLAQFMRTHVPKARDEHLFTLEALVLERLKENCVTVESILNKDVRTPDDSDPEDNGDNEAAARPNNFQFTLMLPKKKLRCLKV